MFTAYMSAAEFNPSSPITMAKKPVTCSLVNAFTNSAFKGNPAVVCLLEEEKDDEWLQAVAGEFNINITCYLTRLSYTASDAVPRFRLRWFGAVCHEVKLCGHGTLAASHFLFSHDLVKSDLIEFSTLSGILTAKRVTLDTSNSDSITNDNFLVELNLPLFPSKEFEGSADDVSTISKGLNGASVREIHIGEDLLVVLPSGKAVVEVKPNFDEIRKCPGRGMIITGLTPPGSEFDFVSRFFAPNFGVDEDPVCGSAHCLIAPFWSKKLGKSNFAAYQASGRGGVLHLHVDEKNQRVLLRGNVVAVMEGSLLV